MSRTHKIQRARSGHLPAKKWRVAYGRVIKDAGGPGNLNSDDYQRAQAAAEQEMTQAGLDGAAAQRQRDEDLRTGGVRYGNQRKMRARMDVAMRRADRKRDADPILDADGEMGLEHRPASAARRRGVRWTR